MTDKEIASMCVERLLGNVIRIRAISAEFTCDTVTGLFMVKAVLYCLLVLFRKYDQQT